MNWVVLITGTRYAFTHKNYCSVITLIYLLSSSFSSYAHLFLIPRPTDYFYPFFPLSCHPPQSHFLSPHLHYGSIPPLHCTLSSHCTPSSSRQFVNATLSTNIPTSITTSTNNTSHGHPLCHHSLQTQHHSLPLLQPSPLPQFERPLCTIRTIAEITTHLSLRSRSIIP